jgi:hypothetical protein
VDGLIRPTGSGGARSSPPPSCHDRPDAARPGGGLLVRAEYRHAGAASPSVKRVRAPIRETVKRYLISINGPHPGTAASCSGRTYGISGRCYANAAWLAPRRGRSRSRTTLRRPLLRLIRAPLTPPTPPAAPVSLRYSMDVTPYPLYRVGCHIHALASYFPSQVMVRTRGKWRMRAPSQHQGHPRYRPAVLRPELDTRGEALSTWPWVLCGSMFHRSGGGTARPCPPPMSCSSY